MGKAENEYLIDSILRDITHTKETTSSLSEQLDIEIDEQQFVGENAKEFAQFLKKFIEVIELHAQDKYIKQLKSLIANPGSSKKDKTKLLLELRESARTTSILATRLIPFIRFTRGSRTEFNPWGLVSLVDRLSQRLVPESRLIVRPEWENDFSFVPINHELYRNAVASARTEQSVYKSFNHYLSEAPLFFSMAYPHVTPGNVLNFSTWAHELGHLVDYHLKKVVRPTSFKLELPDSLDQEEAYDEDLDVYFSREVGRRFRPRITVQGAKQLIKKFDLTLSENKQDWNQVNQLIVKPISLIIKNWAVEIFADIFSFYLFGPATFFVFDDYKKLIEGELDLISSQSYPSDRIRLGILLDLYEEWEPNFPHSTIIKHHNKYYQTFYRKISQLREFANRPFSKVEATGMSKREKARYEIFYEWLITHRDDVKNHFKEALDPFLQQHKDCFVTPEDLPLIFNGLKDLERNVPIEYDFSDDVRNQNKVLGLLINTGWIYWLHKRTNSKISQSNSELFKEFSNINTLLYKSVENYEAKIWYSERKIILN